MYILFRYWHGRYIYGDTCRSCQVTYFLLYSAQSGTGPLPVWRMGAGDIDIGIFPPLVVINPDTSPARLLITSVSQSSLLLLLILLTGGGWGGWSSPGHMLVVSCLLATLYTLTFCLLLWSCKMVIFHSQPHSISTVINFISSQSQL